MKLYGRFYPTFPLGEKFQPPALLVVESNREGRRLSKRSSTRIRSWWKGDLREWRPTQRYFPDRVTKRRARNKMARASRKVNR